MLTPSLHRHPDPERSPDPRIRALVSHLAGLEVAPPLRTHFRSELRAQLVAVAPRLIKDGPGVERPTPPPAPVARRSAFAWLGVIRRPLAVVTCTLAVFVALLGGAVWISQKSLPGDALYGLKRASENLQKAMTSGDTQRAKLLLSFADTRYNEVSNLLPRATAPAARGAAIDAGTAALVKGALDSADDDIRQAMQTLGAQAKRTSSGKQYSAATGWTPSHVNALQAIVGRIPSGALHQRAASSLALIKAADVRAHRVRALGDCGCLASARTDDLGVIPCRTCSSAAGAIAPGTSTRTEPGSRPGSTDRAGTRTATNAEAAASPSVSGPAGTVPAGTGDASVPPAPVDNVPALPSLPGVPSVLNPPGAPPDLGDAGTACSGAPDLSGLGLGGLHLGSCHRS